MTLNYLRSSLFFRRILAVASGTFLAQMVAVVFSPLITRIYSPEIFGLQGVFLSLISILSPIIALRYPMAIIIANTEAEALKIKRLSLVIASFLASVFWGILLIGGQKFATLIGADGLGNLILLIPLALLSIAFENVTQYQAARLGAFRLVGIVSVFQALITNLARVLGGLWSPVASVLIAVSTLAPALQSVMLMIGSSNLRSLNLKISKSDAITLMRKHQDFAIFRVSTDILNSASQAVPVIIFSFLFTPGAAGLYVLTRSILNIPSNIIGAAVGNVIYARYGELVRNSRPLFPLLLKTTLSLFCLTPLIIAIGMFAPVIFTFIFGEDWRGAGNYAQWMSLWLGASIASGPAVHLAPIIRVQRILLIFNIIFFAIRVLAIISVSICSGSDLQAVAAFSVVSLIGIVGLIGVILSASFRFDRAIIQKA